MSCQSPTWVDETVSFLFFSPSKGCVDRVTGSISVTQLLRSVNRVFLSPDSPPDDFRFFFWENFPFFCFSHSYEAVASALRTLSVLSGLGFPPSVNLPCSSQSPLLAPPLLSSKFPDAEKISACLSPSFESRTQVIIVRRSPDRAFFFYSPPVVPAPWLGSPIPF